MEIEGLPAGGSEDEVSLLYQATQTAFLSRDESLWIETTCLCIIAFAVALRIGRDALSFARYLRPSHVVRTRHLTQLVCLTLHVDSLCDWITGGSPLPFLLGLAPSPAPGQPTAHIEKGRKFQNCAVEKVSEKISAQLRSVHTLSMRPLGLIWWWRRILVVLATTMNTSIGKLHGVQLMLLCRPSYTTMTSSLLDSTFSICTWLIW